MATEFIVETDGTNDFGCCPCCGNSSRTVWGYVHEGDETRAAYFVQWTLGHVVERGANFDLILGKWGENANSKMRSAVSLEMRVLDSGPWFGVIDAATQPVAKNGNAGNLLSRNDVIGTSIASETFAIVDAIWLQDSRIQELHQASLSNH